MKRFVASDYIGDELTQAFREIDDTEDDLTYSDLMSMVNNVYSDFEIEDWYDLLYDHINDCIKAIKKEAYNQLKEEAVYIDAFAG